MPSDTTGTGYTPAGFNRPALAPLPAGDEDRGLAPGAGLALGVVLGAALWGGILSVFLLF